jgi:hypothetical protein
MDLDDEIRTFRERRRSEAADAAQLAALQIVCGLDLRAILSGDREQRQKALTTIERMVRRERQRGVQRHWSYDLNRHIALKQACERLRATLAREGGSDDCQHRSTCPQAGTPNISARGVDASAPWRRASTL